MANDFQTVPNQRTVNVHREALDTDFLGIKNENWQSAARDLGPHALRLYLYLASNADGYRFALSPVAIRNAVGMPRSTYHDQFKVLMDKGYLVHKSGNTFDFYEVPIPKRERPASVGDGDENGAFPGNPMPHIGKAVLPENIEINNILYPDTVINNADLSMEGEIDLEQEDMDAEYQRFLKEWEQEERMRQEEEACPVPSYLLKPGKPGEKYVF